MGEEKEKGAAECLFKEIMTENIPDLRKEMDIQIQKVQQTQERMNPRNHTETQHNKLSKVKD